MQTLEWLIQPVTTDLFFDEYWERRPLALRRQCPGYYDALLSLDEIDRALTTLDLRYPNVILKNAARDVAAEEYTLDGGALDVARLYQLFAAGSTVNLAYMDTVIPSLTRLCRGLESAFCHPFQANVYLTPPGNQGAKVHYDTHDVFVLQVAGSKLWKTYGTAIELPLRNQHFEPATHRIGEPQMQFELAAGDAAYIPRGHLHEAIATSSVSLHITVGILAYSWTDFLLESVADACLSDAAFRKALPPGFARDGVPEQQAREMFDRLLQHLSERVSPERILDRFVDEFLASCPPLLRGQMAQLTALEHLDVGTMLETRPHLIARLQTDPHAVSLRHFGRKLTFPLYAAPALRFALSQKRFAVRDLPGDLDDSGKLTLARRLIREGVLVTCQM
ncbi:MAG TPA: cupin domain-containing protein [Steroidobacteraceae bacterium]|nr:cupin domain-containing protein [Steroidobacteraceae bacterium]